jgi:hypothetical protein
LENNEVIALLQARAVVASGNVIGVIPEPSENSPLTGLEIRTNADDISGPATVLGNITRPTEIILDGAVLGAPWAPLNQ